MSSKNRLIRKDNSSTISMIIVVILLIVTIYPVTFVMITSIKTTSEFYTNIWLLPKKLELNNYIHAWVDGHIGEYVINSAIVVCITVVLILAIGAVAAYSLARLKLPFSNFILFLILTCMLIPSEAIIMPLYLNVSKFHLAGTFISLIVPYIGWGLPMTIFIYHTFFKTLPAELLEAAKIDGSGELKIFIKIVIPLMIPATATNAIFNFSGWWGEMIWSSITLQTSSLRTIPLGIMSFNGQFGTDWGPYSAAICIVLIPLVLVFIFTQKYFISGLTGGAIKG